MSNSGKIRIPYNNNEIISHDNVLGGKVSNQKNIKGVEKNSGKNRLRKTSISDIEYCEKLWKKIVQKITSTILSKRILWPVNTKKLKRNNQRSFHFPSVDEIVETVEKVQKYLYKENSTSLNDEYIIDIFIEEESKVKTKPFVPKKGNVGLLSKAFKEDPPIKKVITKRLLERWKIKKTQNKNVTHTMQHVSYTKSTILVRSLYSYLLLLPCYKIFRKNQRNRRSTLMKYEFYPAKEGTKNKYINRELKNVYVFSKIETSLISMEVSLNYTKNLKQIKTNVPVIDSTILHSDVIGSMTPGSKNNSPFGSKSPSPNPVYYENTNNNINNNKKEKQNFNNKKNKKEIKDVVKEKEHSHPRSKPRIIKRRKSKFDRNFGVTPPFSGFGTSLDQTPHFSAGQEKYSPPFGILKPHRKLSFSPYDSPPLKDSTIYRKIRKVNVVANEVTQEVGSMDIPFKLSSFSPPDMYQRNQEKFNKVEFPPPFLGYKFNNNSEYSSPTTSSPKPNISDEDNESGLAFIDESIDNEENLNHEDKVGILLNHIENAPNLSAFFTPISGEPKIVQLSEILEKIGKLEKLKNEILDA